ncbi:MAG: mobility-associated LCxxNW protein [Velocimicrobium sp.]
MSNYCAFSKDHKCIKWMDYEITRSELEEADELCHGNWIEIQRQQEYIRLLQDILIQNGIDFSLEY